MMLQLCENVYRLSKANRQMWAIDSDLVVVVEGRIASRSQLPTFKARLAHTPHLIELRDSKSTMIKQKTYG